MATLVKSNGIQSMVSNCLPKVGGLPLIKFGHHSLANFSYTSHRSASARYIRSTLHSLIQFPPGPRPAGVGRLHYCEMKSINLQSLIRGGTQPLAEITNQ